MVEVLGVVVAVVLREVPVVGPAVGDPESLSPEMESGVDSGVDSLVPGGVDTRGEEGKTDEEVTLLRSPGMDVAGERESVGVTIGSEEELVGNCGWAETSGEARKRARETTAKDDFIFSPFSFYDFLVFFFFFFFFSFLQCLFKTVPENVVWKWGVGG